MRIKTEEKRQAILEVATAVFRELGFERASMSEICTRLGGSKATLYNYFPSKEALFVEVMFRAFEADFHNTLAALQTGDADMAQALRTFGRRFMALLYTPEVVAVRRLLVAEGDRSQIGANCYAQGPCRSHALIAAFLERAMARGLLRTACADLASRQLLALLQAEVIECFMFQHQPLPPIDEIQACADRGTEAFLRLYAPQGPAASMASH